jgi:hypothetical protein
MPTPDGSAARKINCDPSSWPRNCRRLSTRRLLHYLCETQ